MSISTLTDELRIAHRKMTDLDQQQAAFRALEAQARTDAEELALPRVAAQNRFNKLRDDVIRELLRGEGN